MRRTSVVAVTALVVGAVLFVASPASAAPVAGVVTQHDYFLGSLADQTGNGRPGTLGSNATLQADHVALLGGNGSRVSFPSSGTGGTLFGLSEANGGDATIEIWLDFDSTNPPNADADSRYNIFRGDSSGGSDTRFYFDHRQGSPGDEQDVGGSKDSSIISGVYRGGDAQRDKVVGLHQWVYVFDGNQPSADGTWTMYRDGAPMVGAQFGGGLSGASPGLYKTTLGNIFSLAGSPQELAVGGETSQGESIFGTSPKGKLFRMLIYDTPLSANDVALNFQDGLAAGIPEPATLGLLAFSGLALLRRR